MFDFTTPDTGAYVVGHFITPRQLSFVESMLTKTGDAALVERMFRIAEMELDNIGSEMIMAAIYNAWDEARVWYKRGMAFKNIGSDNLAWIEFQEAVEQVVEKRNAMVAAAKR